MWLFTKDGRQRDTEKEETGPEKDGPRYIEKRNRTFTVIIEEDNSWIEYDGEVLFDRTGSDMYTYCLLKIVVFSQGDEKVDVYLPNATWYSYPNFDKKWVAPTSGLRTTLDAPIMGNVPIIMRGGFTIVIQTPDVTTTKR